MEPSNYDSNSFVESEELKTASVEFEKFRRLPSDVQLDCISFNTNNLEIAEEKNKKKSYKTSVFVNVPLQKVFIDWEQPYYPISKKPENSTEETPEITVGPVIGLVTQTTARILIEMSCDYELEVKLVPQTHLVNVSSLRTLKKTMVANYPQIFCFSKLQPNTYYDVKTSLPYIHGVVHSGFRTLRKDWSLRHDHARIAFVSQEGFTVSEKIETHEESNPWKSLSMLATRGTIDYIIHTGGFVMLPSLRFDANFDMEDATKKKKRFKQNKDDNWILSYYRNVYRQSWRRPYVRHVLANCPNLVACSNDDLGHSWMLSYNELHQYQFRIDLNSAIQAYCEYQRVLYEDWDVYVNRSASVISEISSVFLCVKNPPLYHAHCFGDIGFLCCEFLVSCIEIDNFYNTELIHQQLQYYRNCFINSTQEKPLFAKCKTVFVVLSHPWLQVSDDSHKEKKNTGNQGEIELLFKYSTFLAENLVKIVSEWKRQHSDQRRVYFVVPSRCQAKFHLIQNEHIQISVLPIVQNNKHIAKSIFEKMFSSNDESSSNRIDVATLGLMSQKNGFLVVSIAGQYDEKLNEHPAKSWFLKRPLKPEMQAALISAEFDKLKRLPLFQTSPKIQLKNVSIFC